MTAGTGPTHPANPRPTSPPPPPRPTLATGPITQPPGEPPTIPPKHPGVLWLYFTHPCDAFAHKARVRAKLTRRSLAAGAR